MAKEYAKAFYNSAAWKHTSKAYAASVFYLCESCGRPYKIVHHIKHITPSNIGNAEITLSWSNLQCLCLDCHNKAHGNNNDSRVMQWDDDGNLIGCTDEHTPPTTAIKSDFLLTGGGLFCITKEVC